MEKFITTVKSEIEKDLKKTTTIDKKQLIIIDNLDKDYKYYTLVNIK